MKEPIDQLVEDLEQAVREYKRKRGASQPEKEMTICSRTPWMWVFVDLMGEVWVWRDGKFKSAPLEKVREAMGLCRDILQANKEGS